MVAAGQRRGGAALHAAGHEMALVVDGAGLAVVDPNQQTVVHDLEPAQEEHVLRQLGHQLRHHLAHTERAAQVHVLEGLAFELPREAEPLVNDGAAVNVRSLEVVDVVDGNVHRVVHDVLHDDERHAVPGVAIRSCHRKLDFVEPVDPGETGLLRRLDVEDVVIQDALQQVALGSLRTSTKPMQSGFGFGFGFGFRLGLGLGLRININIHIHIFGRGADESVEGSGVRW